MSSQTGIKYAKSLATGFIYEVTKWEEKGDHIKALEKRHIGGPLPWECSVCRARYNGENAAQYCCTLGGAREVSTHRDD